MKAAFILIAVALYAGCSASPTDMSGAQQQSFSAASSSGSTTTRTGSGGVALPASFSASSTDVSRAQQQSSSAASSSGSTTTRIGSVGMALPSSSSASLSGQTLAGSAKVAVPLDQTFGQGYLGGGSGSNGLNDGVDFQTGGNSHSALGNQEALLLAQNHPGHHICIPDFPALGLISKVMGSLQNLLPLLHAGNHKLQDVMYSLAKSLPAHGGNFHFPAGNLQLPAGNLHFPVGNLHFPAGNLPLPVGSSHFSAIVKPLQQLHGFATGGQGMKTLQGFAGAGHGVGIF